MQFLRLALLSALLAPSLHAQALKTNLVVAGLQRPSWVGSPAGDQRIFVLEQNGRVRVILNNQLLATPFLDIDPLVGSLGNEQGLLGMAFDPGYATNGRFYLSYTDNTGASVLARYTNPSPGGNVADPASALILFGPLPHPQTNHNGGAVVVGPDGMLYYGLGDGGNANDTGSGHDVGGNAQSMSTYLGKLLRIDPANPAVPPPGNPFPASAIPLAWAIGLRNPWSFDFDPATGELYLADVGQNAWEELDVEPAGSSGGANYGWRCMEGSHCTGLSGCSCGAGSLTLPVHEYAHAAGNCAIIGGPVYRGSGIPALAGRYFFADYCSGRIWSLVYSNGQVSELTDRTAQLAPTTPLAIDNPVAIGTDGNGEILILDQSGGELYRIDMICGAPQVYCQAAFNSTGFPASMTSSGNGSLSANNLNLITVTCPPGVHGIYFYGEGQTLAPLGNGWLCIASSIVRLPVVTVDAFGDATYHPNLPTLQGAGLGVTKNFQFWYRDPAGGGALFNVSDALSVTLCN